MTTIGVYVYYFLKQSTAILCVIDNLIIRLYTKIQCYINFFNDMKKMQNITYR